MTKGYFTYKISLGSIFVNGDHIMAKLLKKLFKEKEPASPPPSKKTHPPKQKILTAEGWRRLMMGRGAKKGGK